MREVQKDKTTFLILAYWALPMAWVASIPKSGHSSDAKQRTEIMLQIGEKAASQFIKEYGAPPRNLCELKAYAKAKNSEFSGWDGYGQRFDYLRLSKERWYLRSFGSDGRQNTVLSRQDPIVSSVLDDKPRGIQHSYSRSAIRYNPAIRLGAVSPQGNWHGEIFTDSISGASRLLVRHRDDRGYFMISEQNTVEEFYWLPDGYRLVFTATASNRYRDGIFVWNLLSDEIINVFPGETKIGVGNESGVDHWYISLAGVHESPPTVMAFVAPRNDNIVDVATLFSPENFIAIELNESGKTVIHSGSESAALYSNPLKSPWSTMSDISQCSDLPASSLDWCNLKLEGPFQTILAQWQNFTERNAESPIFPYALFQLTYLYGDTYALFKDYVGQNPSDTEGQRNSEIIRSYGSELAHALASMTSAPSWLRGTAAHARNLFSLKTPLPYQLSKVMIQKSDKAAGLDRP